MNLPFPVLLGVFFVLPAFAQTGGVPAEPAPRPEVRLDADLDQAPSYYRERVRRFREILRGQPSRAARIRKASALAAERRSEFRKDALNFLAAVRAREAVPDLERLCKDPDVREFVLFTLGRSARRKRFP